MTGHVSSKARLLVGGFSNTEELHDDRHQNIN